MITDCSICNWQAETRYIDLFVFGSEGVRLCHECEMQLVEHCRELVSNRLERDMTISKLKRQARAIAKTRGHKLSNWQNSLLTRYPRATTTCVNCGATAIVTHDGAFGNALFTNCKGED